MTKVFAITYVETIAGRGKRGYVEMYCSTPAEVRRELFAKKRHPINIKPKRKPLLYWTPIRTDGWRLSLLEQLRAQIDHLNVEQAFLAIIKEEPNSLRRLALAPARSILSSGGSFSAAVANLELFDTTVISMLTVGARSGDMTGALDQAIIHLEDKIAEQHRLQKLGSFLVWEVLSVMSLVTGIQFTFLPYLRDMGLENNDPVKLAAFNRALDWAALINGTLCWVMSGLILFGIAIWLAFCSKQKTRLESWLRGAVVSVPYVGPYMVQRLVAETSRMMARLLSGGVAFDTAAQICETNSTAPFIRNYWQTVLRAIGGGSLLNVAVARQPFLPLEQNRLNSVANSTQLAKALVSIAKDRDRRAEVARSRMQTTGWMLLLTLFAAAGLLAIGLLYLANDNLHDSVDSIMKY